MDSFYSVEEATERGKITGNPIFSCVCGAYFLRSEILPQGLCPSCLNGFVRVKRPSKRNGRKKKWENGDVRKRRQLIFIMIDRDGLSAEEIADALNADLTEVKKLAFPFLEYLKHGGKVSKSNFWVAPNSRDG